MKIFTKVFAVVALTFPTVGKSLEVSVSEGGRLACTQKLGEAVFESAASAKGNKFPAGTNPAVFTTEYVQYRGLGQDTVILGDSIGTRYEVKFSANYTMYFLSSAFDCGLEPTSHVDKQGYVYEIKDLGTNKIVSNLPGTRTLVIREKVKY